MDFIVAILMYIGVAGGAQDVTPELIEENQNQIEYYQSDEGFLDYYQATQQTESIGIMDIHDMD